MLISTIFTGGTIGSHMDKSGYISTDSMAKYRLIEMYKASLQHTNSTSIDSACADVEFLTSEPYTILSENLDATHINKLVKCVNEILTNKDTPVQGIIITHGSDTIQYTASILSYVFGCNTVPIILVCSAYILDDPRQNGLQNFAAAVDFIKNERGNGVFIAYKNPNDSVLFHYGTRMQNPGIMSASIDSVLNANYPSEEGCTAHLPISAFDFELNEFASSILRIKVYPGMIYPTCLSKVQAVLLETYHSGTICINDDLKRFAKLAKENEVPIYLVGLNTSEAEYATVAEYEALGIIAIPAYSAISQYCKLWIATSHDLDIKNIMQVSYAKDWMI